MNKYIEAIEKMKQGDFLASYEEFTKIISENKKDYFAIFYRALIDFLHLNQFMDQSIADFEFCITEKSPFETSAKAYLTIFYSNNDEPHKSIIYGTECLKNGTELTLDVNFALSKSYYQIGDYFSLLKSLEHINKCIEIDEDENVDFYVCKVDLLLTLNKLEDADNTLNTIYSNFGGSFSYYYLKAKLRLLEYRATNDCQKLNSAIRDIDLSLQYEENSFTAVSLKIEILSVYKKKEEALKLLETVKDEYEEDGYLVEKFKIYEEIGEVDTILKLGEEYLKHQESWRIYYSIAFIKSKTAQSREEILELKDLYEKAFNLNPEIFIYNELYRLNFILNKDEENLKLTDYLCELHPNDGRLTYLKAECLHRMHFDYDDVVETMSKSHDEGYLEDLRFLTIITPLIEKPKSVYKALKAFQKNDLMKLSSWMKRKMGLRYLYGEEGYKQDIVKASELITSAYCDESDDSCMIATYARLLELTEQHNEAFIHYNKAYIAECNEVMPACNCAHGYLAHAYMQGIGIEKNIEEAAKLIKLGIELSKGCSSNIVIYLYAYFALLNREGFDLNLAKQYLEGKYPFCRYEISRPMMLKLIYKRLGLDTTEIDKTIKLCIKYGEKSNKKYYKLNKDLDLIYPSLNNY